VTIRHRAAALATVALLVGGMTAGCAATSGNAGDAPQTAQTGAPPDRGGSDTSALVAALASTFSLDEATVQAAVDDAMSSLGGRGGGRPAGQSGDGPDDSGNPPSASPGDSGNPPSPPAGGQGMGGGGQLAERLAASIATALDLDEAEVLTVVQANLPQRGGSGGDQNAPNPQPTPTS